jgi:hypothetical protein
MPFSHVILQVSPKKRKKKRLVSGCSHKPVGSCTGDHRPQGTYFRPAHIVRQDVNNVWLRRDDRSLEANNAGNGKLAKILPSLGKSC